GRGDRRRGSGRAARASRAAAAVHVDRPRAEMGRRRARDERPDHVLQDLRAPRSVSASDGSAVSRLQTRRAGIPLERRADSMSSQPRVNRKVARKLLAMLAAEAIGNEFPEETLNRILDERRELQRSFQKYRDVVDGALA